MLADRLDADADVPTLAHPLLASIPEDRGT